MQLSTVFDYLAFGELSQYASGNNDAGRIAHSDYPKIISYVNLALTKLHTMLPLKSNQCLIQGNPAVVEYKLTKENAQTVNEFGFILDNADNPFTDDILSVVSVHSEIDGVLPLNDTSEEDGVFTPKYNVIQIGRPQFMRYVVEYRANHPLLQMSELTDPSQVNIDIPDNIVECLLQLVMARTLRSQGSAEGIQEALILENKVRQECEEYKLLGHSIEAEHSDNNFYNRGWV